jgi:hypothetical protein
MTSQYISPESLISYSTDWELMRRFVPAHKDLKVLKEQMGSE